jgi:hypothetical protein
MLLEVLAGGLQFVRRTVRQLRHALAAWQGVGIGVQLGPSSVQRVGKGVSFGMPVS